MNGIGDFTDLIAQRMIAQQTSRVNTTLERLATGRRINGGADDPAGLIAAENLSARSSQIRAEIDGLERQSLRAAAEDGARSVVSDLMVELDSLAVSAANTAGMTDAEREAIQLEADSIIDAAQFVAQTTTFAGERVFDDESFDFSDLNSIRSGGEFSFTGGDIESAQSTIRGFAASNNNARATQGAQVRYDIGSRIESLSDELVSVEQSVSIIRDTDYALETANLVRNQLLQQSAISSALLGRQQRGAATLALLG